MRLRGGSSGCFNGGRLVLSRALGASHVRSGSPFRPRSGRSPFASHPRIGDVDALRARFGSAPAASSAREQAGLDGAGATVLRALLDGNREYETRFGYIFIVCATGRTAGQMLDALRARLTNPPDVEIGIAAEEHAKICDLRIADRVEDARSRARAGAQ